MLREWKHPLAADADFQQALLESAAEILRASINGNVLSEDILPENMNLISAIHLAEATTLASNPEIGVEERAARHTWLDAVRRSIPSCFCDPGLLP